ncbi:MAG TPA: LysE family translocator [Gaiellaceae bacterium]|nr:LysE family translocator [Gaiellaceae bacterium]
MPSLVSLVPFVIGSVLITIAPGPDMALITRQVLAHGQRVARATIAGNVTGVLVHTLLVAFGLSAVLLASVKVFDAVKIAGAVYLVYLGVMSIRHARRPTDARQRARRRPEPQLSVPVATPRHAWKPLLLRTVRRVGTGIARDRGIRAPNAPDTRDLAPPDLRLDRRLPGSSLG